MKRLYYLLSLFILIITGHAVEAQSSLTGKVIDESKNPIAGVTVKLVERGSTMSTGSDGSFSFSSVEFGTYTLSASYIGYETKQVKFTLKNSNQPVTIVMQEIDNALQGVEITGRKEQAYKNTKSFSGTKTETPLRYVPQSISYVTKEVMEDQQAFKASDIIKNISGATHFSYYNNDITLRGFRSGNALIND